MIFPRKALVASTVTTGVARVDERTKRLVKRLNYGDIAVINHDDIDRVAAEALVVARPSAVINAGRSLTGRYPNLGALILVQEGIRLIDEVDDVFSHVTEGQTLTIDGGRILDGDRELTSGHMLTVSELRARVEDAKAGLSKELQAFAENTLAYVREESDLLFDPPDPPELNVSFSGRHVMVVVRGHEYREDLQHLRSYVRDVHPVIIAVDGGADVCLEHDLTPHIILGDFDSVTDDALRCGAQLVVHAYVGGDAPGAARLTEMGLPYVTYEAPGMSEDVAMLLAYDEGAELIVAVGTHASMVEFLDKGRAGMASTFLTRLKVGPRLVDAKGVSRLYAGTLRKSDMAFLIASALVAFVVMALVLEPFRTFVSNTWFLIGEFFDEFMRTITPW